MWFHPDYLRKPDPALVLSILEPQKLFAPNVKPPLVCIGPILPSTPAVELLARVHSVVTFADFTTDESDALSSEACAWVRRNLEKLPVDLRPFKRRNADTSGPHKAEDNAMTLGAGPRSRAKSPSDATATSTVIEIEVEDVTIDQESRCSG